MNSTINYYNSENFVTEKNTISLVKYSKNVISVLPSDSLELKVGNGIGFPEIINEEGTLGVRIEDDGLIPISKKKIVVEGSARYANCNFQNFLYGAIRFRVKDEANTGFGQQTLVSLKDFPEDLENYAIGVEVYTENPNVVEKKNIIVELERKGTLASQAVDIYNKIRNALGYNDALVIENNPPKFDVEIIQSGEGDTATYSIKFFTKYPDYHLELVEPDLNETNISYKLLSDLFTSISEPLYMNFPKQNMNFLSLEAKEVKNDIRFIHKTDGYCWLQMNDNSGTTVIEKRLFLWDYTNTEWIEVEFDFNEQFGFVFVDGKLKTIVFLNDIIRELPKTDLVLRGGPNNPYSFSGVMFFDEIQHSKDYDASTTATSYDAGYPTNNPYIDIHFGSITTYSDKILIIEGTNEPNAHLVGSVYNGSRLLIGGITAGDSLTINSLISEFAGLELNDFYDCIIRLYFVTDGYENVILNKFDINIGTKEDTGSTTDPNNFEDIYNFIRRSLGYPNVPVELTEEQMFDALNLAVFEYNRYRNSDESLDTYNTIDLRRADDGSYYLPPGTSDDDIIEIIFKPRYSWAWYAGDNSLMANLYMQTLFNGYDVTKSAADYYINITTQNDLKNLFGTQSGWKIYNHRLYLFPRFEGMETLTIGIKYREVLSVEEILNSIQIKKLALGYSMITLGHIRSTFGNQIPAGDGSMITLNGDALRQEGKELVNEMITELKSQQKPLFMWWS